MKSAKAIYFEARAALLAKNGGNENDMEVRLLDKDYAQQLQVANAGGNRVDVSNQANQHANGSARVISKYSDEQAAEFRYFQDRLRREENQDLYDELSDAVNDPDNFDDMRRS